MMFKKEKKFNLCVYNNKIKRTHLISDILYFYKKFGIKYFILNKKIFSVCGRVCRKRVMGRSIFLDIIDISGIIQIYLSRNFFKEEYQVIINNLNLGDIIFVNGYLFQTKTFELSLNIFTVLVLSNNINTFPDKISGLLDKELCYRSRYLDLISNNITFNKFYFRSKFISKIRNFFLSKKYIEVETPILQFIIGGADAKPFETYNNSFNSKMYFRIAPELYLKRLLVGGFEKVFEIGKNFRNEGVSTKHHAEFTTIEFYESYVDYKYFMKLTEILIKYLINYFFNNNYIIYNNIFLDFSSDFIKIDFMKSLIKYSKIKKNSLFNFDFLKDLFFCYNIDISDLNDIFKLQNKLFEIIVEKNLIQPTFILHHPVSISPLSRRLDNNFNFVERFELYIFGYEIANGFSELNNPDDQLLRFKNQIKKNENIDNKFIDLNYIDSLRYGLAPCAGEGIGLDRLFMIFTNSLSIKDVILFPLIKLK